MKKNELIVSIVLIAICVLGIVAMIFRADQIDRQNEIKKELSNTPVQNDIR